jgi:hypothetical protein
LADSLSTNLRREMFDLRRIISGEYKYFAGISYILISLVIANAWVTNFCGWRD